MLVLTTGSTFGLAFFLGQTSVRHPGTTQPTASTPDTSLVCLGYVDLENGVTSLAPLNPGRIVKVLVRETALVKQGQVLLQLEDKPARHRVDEAEAALAAAQNQLRQAKGCKRIRNA